MNNKKIIQLKNGRKAHIRELNHSDKHAILEFYREIPDKNRILFFEGYRSFYSWRTKKIGDSVIYIDGLDVDKKKSWSLIAVLEDHPKIIIGDIRAYLNENDNSAEISLIIKEEFRGMGVGTKLLESMINKLKKLGLKKIYCLIDEENDIMIHLINKFNFKKENTGENIFYRTL
ncbi:MAG: GNAT family N-acetyltransferase [Candidatus Odinarchaeia archaeon]